MSMEHRQILCVETWLTYVIAAASIKECWPPPRCPHMLPVWPNPQCYCACTTGAGNVIQSVQILYVVKNVPFTLQKNAKLTGLLQEGTLPVPMISTHPLEGPPVPQDSATTESLYTRTSTCAAHMTRHTLHAKYHLGNMPCS